MMLYKRYVDLIYKDTGKRHSQQATFCRDLAQRISEASQFEQKSQRSQRGAIFAAVGGKEEVFFAGLAASVQTRILALASRRDLTSDCVKERKAP